VGRRLKNKVRANHLALSNITDTVENRFLGLGRKKVKISIYEKIKKGTVRRTFVLSSQASGRTEKTFGAEILSTKRKATLEKTSILKLSER